VETLPPEIKQAIEEKKPIEGMDRDQVVMALGKPTHKTRETKEGVEYEDWIYGQPPGRVTFVTFAGVKVVRIKETYAGLGGSIADTPPQP
jgi:outer membrane protein assembly factor BamE (lipoprotein component of BamABCDE complex)